MPAMRDSGGIGEGERTGAMIVHRMGYHCARVGGVPNGVILTG